MSRSLPTRAARDTQTGGSRREVTVADNVVALKDRRRLVAGQLHRYAFGHARAHQIPHRCSSEVVRNAAGTSGGEARRRPRFVEPLNRFRVLRSAALVSDQSEKDVRLDLPASLESL